MIDVTIMVNVRMALACVLQGGMENIVHYLVVQDNVLQEGTVFWKMTCGIANVNLDLVEKTVALQESYNVMITKTTIKVL